MTTPIARRRQGLPLPLISFLFMSALILYCSNSQARQGLGTSSNTVAGPPAYAEVSRGPHSRVMQQTFTMTNLAGTVVTRTNGYTEMATGMSVLSNGIWTASSDQIQITANGAQATNCQHQVFFPGDFSGAIDLITPDGQHMISDVVAIAYYDGTTNVIIGSPQDSVGQLLPSLNQVLYTNAFSGIEASVLYRNSRSGFEQDIILNAQLPSPSTFGLSGSNSCLQVWTEFTSSPSPAISERPNGDESLDFGVMKMESGKAFLMGGASNSVPTVKQWGTSGGRTFLIESVPLSLLAAQMAQLPLPSSSSGSSNSVPGAGSPSGGGESKVRLKGPLLASGAPPHQAFDKVGWPRPKPIKKAVGTMRIAATGLPPRGLVLDYITVNGSMTNVTFQSDTTYYVSDDLELYETTTIEGGTVIKNGTPATSGAGFVVHGDFACLTSPYRPAIFTCTNDDTVGESLDDGAGTPADAQGTTYLYPQVVEEFTVNGSTNLSKVFTYGQSLICQRVPGISTNFFGMDGHGSTRFLTDTGGNITNVFAYDAYGNFIASNSTPQTAYLYSGEQFDSDVGFYYLRARYMTPNTGRFWTMDTYEGDQENPLSLHKYTYCEASPVDHLDRSGNDIGDVMDIMESFDLGGLPGVVFSAAQYVYSSEGAVVVRAMVHAEQLIKHARVKLRHWPHFDKADYVTWFGKPTRGNMSFVRDVYKASEAKLKTHVISWQPGTTHLTTWIAYSRHYSNIIYLNPRFWREPNTGTDSKAETIVHELAHIVTSQVGDFTYGTVNAKKLASTDPDYAIENAANYQYFAGGDQ